MEARIEIVKGDITRQPDIDTVVNAANAQLAPGGGVAGAIHRAAGPELYREARALAPIEPGQCVITRAHNLPNQHVIHCLGPRYGIDEPADKRLAQCYANALDLAEDRQIHSIAFPAISTGAFGYPINEAADIALRTVMEKRKETRIVKLVRFVLYDENALEVFQAAKIKLAHPRKE